MKHFQELGSFLLTPLIAWIIFIKNFLIKSLIIITQPRITNVNLIRKNHLKSLTSYKNVRNYIQKSISDVF